jgi:hypothetical protein
MGPNSSRKLRRLIPPRQRFHVRHSDVYRLEDPFQRGVALLVELPLERIGASNRYWMGNAALLGSHGFGL